MGVQNGMTVDTIADVVGPAADHGLRHRDLVDDVRPRRGGAALAAARSWFAVGASTPATAGREGEIADLLRLVGAVEVVDDIRAAKWMKLVSNATTLVTTAILGVPMLEAVAMPGMREFMLRVRPGGARRRRGARPPGAADLRARRGRRAPDETASSRRCSTRCSAGFVLPHTKTTVLQDWMKGRHSEVDDLNGLVVAEQAGLGGAAPVNAAVVESPTGSSARRGPARRRQRGDRCGTSPVSRRS